MWWQRQQARLEKASGKLGQKEGVLWVQLEATSEWWEEDGQRRWARGCIGNNHSLKEIEATPTCEKRGREETLQEVDGYG